MCLACGKAPLESVLPQWVAFRFVNLMSPPVCPSCQGDNTIPQGLNIISRFFRSFAPAISFYEARYTRYYATCFSGVYFSAPCLLIGLGAGFFSAAGTAVDIHMLMKGAPLLLSRCRGLAASKPKQANGQGGLEGPLRQIHTCPKNVWLENRVHVQFVSYCTAWASWSSTVSALLSRALVLLGKRAAKQCDSRTIWCDIFQIWICIVCSVFEKGPPWNGYKQKQSHLHGATGFQEKKGKDLFVFLIALINFQTNIEYIL